MLNIHGVGRCRWLQSEGRNAMPWTFLIASFALGAVTGFATFSQGRFFGYTVAGKAIQGLLGIACFGAVIMGFWQYGWKIGLLEIFVVFAGSAVSSRQLS